MMDCLECLEELSLTPTFVSSKHSLDELSEKLRIPIREEALRDMFADAISVTKIASCDMVDAD